MCIEKADNVLLPSVELARVNRRGKAKRHSGRPHGVSEIVLKTITSHVPPYPDPDDDMLLELSAEHDHSNGASDRYAEIADTVGPDPEESCHTWRKRKMSRSHGG